MMFIYLSIMAACWWIGRSMGIACEKQRAVYQLQQQQAFTEQLDIERKKAADETKKQLKFENDARNKIRKQIEKEERTTK